jgi:3-phenylpropionate/cinnamic acid dioxygenase small subunit
VQAAPSIDPTLSDAPLPWADEDVHSRVRLFLDREAELLDNRWLKDWIELLDADFTYQMPVPITPDNPVAPHYDASAFVINETRETLADHWLRRLEPDMWEIAWAEVPPVRMRHFISNIRVRALGNSRYDVRSNVLLSATRQSEQSNFTAVERFDTIHEGPTGIRLLSRFVVPETTVLALPHLRVIL